MSLTGREDISISKRDVVESKKFASTSKKLVFAHKCTGGETSINLLSLTMPTELAANGFANPSSAELAAAKMVFNKKSVRLRSSLSGELMQFSDFVVSSSLSIQFLGILGTIGAQPGEIFMCEIQDIPVKELVVADTRPVTRTYELAVGQTTLNLGEIYKVGANLDIGSQVGDIKVWRNGPIQLRNVDNATASPSADGNFQEVDAGNGYSQVIEFNDAPVGQPDSIVVEFGRQIVSGDVNYIGAVESLYGALLAMAPDLAAAAHGDANIARYIATNASQLERRQFGDLVYNLLSRVQSLEIDRIVAEYEANATQSVTTPGSFNLFRYHNLIRDPSGIYNPSTGTITFPKDAEWLVIASTNVNVLLTSSGYQRTLLDNDVAYIYGNGVSQIWQTRGVSLKRWTAGQTLQVGFDCSGAASSTSDNRYGRLYIAQMTKD